MDFHYSVAEEVAGEKPMNVDVRGGPVEIFDLVINEWPLYGRIYINMSKDWKFFI